MLSCPESASSQSTGRPLLAVAPLPRASTPRQLPSPSETPSPRAPVVSSPSLRSSSPFLKALKLSDEFRRERERGAATVPCYVPAGFSRFVVLRRTLEANPQGLEPRDLPMARVLHNRLQGAISKLDGICGLSQFFREHCSSCWGLTGRPWKADHVPFTLCFTRVHPNAATGVTVGPAPPAFSPTFHANTACPACWMPRIRCGNTVYGETNHLDSGVCVHPRPEAFLNVAWAVYSSPVLFERCRRDFEDRSIPINASVEQWEAWLTRGYHGLTHLGHLLFWLFDVYGCIGTSYRGPTVLL